MLIAKKEIEVRYSETDQMGIVYHGNYLPWMELGRISYMKALGFTYFEMEERGVVSPVLEVKVQYKKAIKYGDDVTIHTQVSEYNGFKVIYNYEIYNQHDELCVTGETSHICVDKETFKPIIMKKKFPEWHTLYENAIKKDF